MTEILAIIPARGGSKGIPHKNIRSFAGKPLIFYSIKTALNSKLISRVIVSTDDPKIRNVAIKFGAEAPFLRPKKYALDLSPDFPAFVHALTWLNKNEDYRPDIVVHLRPTSPLRNITRVDRAIELLLNHPKADSVRAVIIPSQNPFKMWSIQKNGFMKPLVQSKYKEAYNMPRQLLPKVFWQTGYVDAVRASTILKKHSMTGDYILPLLLNPDEWIDIDIPGDWKKAEEKVGFKPKHRSTSSAG